MSGTVRARLLGLLTAPETAPGLTPGAWSPVLGAARRCGLMGRLAHRLEQAGVLAALPPGPRRHLRSATVAAAQHRRDVLRELDRVALALATVAGPKVLLKGAAYVRADLAPAAGRTYGDIDVMVPPQGMAEAEAALRLAGWLPVNTDAYDRSYYVRWMHQVPPLQHIQTGSVIDLHHTIVPRTARTPVHSGPLLSAAVDVPGQPFQVLSPEDMVLHSAVHLFDDGTFDKALRDLSDIDLLLRQFTAGDPAFWSRLCRRAEALGLGAVLDHALTACAALWRTPVPAPLLQRPRPRAARLLDRVFDKALTPDHPAVSGLPEAVARGFLYMRGHMMRMPLYLLVPHALRKMSRQIW